MNHERVDGGTAAGDVRLQRVLEMSDARPLLRAVPQLSHATTLFGFAVSAIENRTAHVCRLTRGDERNVFR